MSSYFKFEPPFSVINLTQFVTFSVIPIKMNCQHSRCSDFRVYANIYVALILPTTSSLRPCSICSRKQNRITCRLLVYYVIITFLLIGV